jgi:hypothetical protein
MRSRVSPHIKKPPDGVTWFRRKNQINKITKREGNNMFLGIGGILGILWVLGMAYGYRMGGAIYIVLAAAILMTCLGLRQWWQRPVA